MLPNHAKLETTTRYKHKVNREKKKTNLKGICFAKCFVKNRQLLRRNPHFGSFVQYLFFVTSEDRTLKFGLKFKLMGMRYRWRPISVSLNKYSF